MAYVSASSANGTSSAVVTAPANIADGDILVCVINTYQGNAAPTFPSGFTTWYDYVSGNDRVSIAWKRASSESGDYTCTGASGTSVISAGISVYRGRLASGDPLDVGSNTSYTTNDTAVRGAGVTIATAGSDLIWAGFLYTGSASISAPSGMTLRCESWRGNQTAFLADVVNQSTGATGDKDGTSGGSTGYKHAFLVTLKPAAASGISMPLLNHLLLGDN